MNDKTKNKKYHTVGTVPKSQKRGKINTRNTHIHNCLLSWLVTVTLIKSGGVKLVLWAQTSLLSEMLLTIIFLFKGD
jgi:hypothetical protein